MTTERPDDVFRPWDIDQSEDVDRAIGLLRALNAAYSARIAHPRPGDDLEQLRAERRRYATEQRHLNPADQPTIVRILTEYPAVLRQVRTGPP
ncbi:hypothetical protein ACFO1B_43920 [Dactylosporangium siamense]|uniref:Uncharacterized protein n=1 Tax=Dactylosporangium siamense TaxID=685454 RepID=A0A919Q2E0_9ACTN|nr:hypothetical protein [Dactylosporangium siamense]GIG53153.1 hypothetical protein Dsi01nite_111940 [Dactylosporangium siamense]